jgi:hypothetical protein
MVIGSQLSFAQKVLSSASKRIKTGHLDPPTAGKWFLMSCLSLYIYSFKIDPATTSTGSRDPNVIPDQVLHTVRDIAQSGSFYPSPASLRAHIAELELELNSVDFRLQYFYLQRTNVASALVDARLHLKKSLV